MAQYLVLKDNDPLKLWIDENRQTTYLDAKFLHVANTKEKKNYFLSIPKSTGFRGKRVTKDDIVVMDQVISIDTIEDLVYADLNAEDMSQLNVYEIKPVIVDPGFIFLPNYQELFPAEDTNLYTETIAINLRARPYNYKRAIYKHMKSIAETLIKENDLKALGRLYCICASNLDSDLVSLSYLSERNCYD